MHLTVNNELATYIPRTDKIDIGLLKADIVKNGIKQPIEYAVINNKNIIIDGHLRYQIGKEVGLIGFPVKLLPAISSLEQAKHFMLLTQLGKRTLDKRNFNLFIGDYMS